MNIVMFETSIRQDKDGRYCLNDLHKAAGGEERHSPNRWTRTEGYNALLDELTQVFAFDPAKSIRGGSNPGTYVVKSLAIRYAMWISPSVLDLFIKQIEDMDSVIKALNDLEIPDDLPDMYVYAIRNKDTGNVKIGISKHPEERLKQLQTGCDGLLELIAVRPAENRYADEKRLHNDNSKHHIHGEWFTEEAVV